MIVATTVVLLAAGACFFFRLLRGPTLADRVIGVNGLLLVGMAAIAAHAAETTVGAFVPTVVVVALVGFVGTAIVARFIEGPGR